MPSFMEVITECNRLGFEITGMFPVSRDTNNLAIVEFDCVMARRRPVADGPKCASNVCLRARIHSAMLEGQICGYTSRLPGKGERHETDRRMLLRRGAL
jgi:hypothetical protein